MQHAMSVVSRGAPALALLVLLGMPMLLRQVKPDQKSIEARHLQVASAVAHVPWRIGNYMGEDVEMPAAAVEILRPNATLSRLYRQDNGPSYTLIVIHCSDARDMQGHYPPSCYPSNGWVAEVSRQPTACAIEVNTQPFPMQVYHFQRLEGVGIQRRMRVFNCFILPDGHVAADTSALNEAVKRYAMSVRGIAQVQVVCSSDIDFEQSREAVRELLSGISSLLHVLGGVSENGAQST